MNFSVVLNDEVARLQRLRQSALKVRTLAKVLNRGNGPDGIFKRGALLHWRIARIATGRLRSYPYQSYPRDPSFFEGRAERLATVLLGTMARLRGHGAETFLRELRGAARELDDTRALTLSAELSDALGRAQSAMRSLIDDVQTLAAREAGLAADPRRDADDGLSAPPLSTSSYLALKQL